MLTRGDSAVSIIIWNPKTTIKIKTTHTAPETSSPRTVNPEPLVPSPRHVEISTSPIVGIIHVAQDTAATTVDVQEILCAGRPVCEIAEPRIPLDPGLRVHPAGGVLEELPDDVLRVRGLVHAELGDPDRVARAARDRVRLRQVLREVVDVVGRRVPVQVEEVDRQVHGRRVAEELRQVVEPAVAVVRHRGRADAQRDASR